jgi:hypothetical protein
LVEGAEVEDIAGFLEDLQGRLFGHPTLARLRADKKLNLVLGEVAELVDLQRIAQRHQFYVEDQLACPSHAMVQ